MPDNEREKEKIDQTDKMDDTKKADELEAEAHKDKEGEEKASEESGDDSKKEESKKGDEPNSKEEAYKADITELKSIIASQSKRLDLLEERIVEVSANQSSSESEESEDTGFIAM